MTSITCFKTCMHDNIANTLDIIDQLKSPVVRSCHIGNNTSNNWGLLTLSPNIQLVQYDHTTYGLDENCAPWLVLGDNGLIIKCYDHKGIEKPEQCGIHINTHIKNICEKKYNQHLNYGLFPQFNEVDLINYHYNTAAKLSNQINRSSASFDSREILNIKELLTNIFRTFFNLKRLDLIFDRWVLKSKKGYVVMLKIGTINYLSDNTLEIYTNTKLQVFLGSIEKLIEQFFSNIKIVHDRIICAKHFQSVSYPWVTLKFSYLIPTIKEFTLDSVQKNYWHAGGSASQYYINNNIFVKEMNNLVSALIINKFLPTNVYINLIPSFCCQLFATNLVSLQILEDMISIWMSYKKTNKILFNNIISSLAATDHPLNTIKLAFKNLDNKVISQLKCLMLNFNVNDINKLPIAHITNYPSNSYNKYGIAQHNLLDKKILIPSNFKHLSWGEGELLIKILAETVISEYY